MSTDVTVTRSPARRRYEASVGDTAVAGFIDYEETSELIVLTHTEVAPAFEGRGVASTLARAALDEIRERDLKALVICPYIIAWLRRHPEYQDLLYNAARPKTSNQPPDTEQPQPF
ncbi:GNAT family N-acetyltransferase [Actinomadura sp. 7K534]|uniref:GNAT family N-acetyltransferase n=1 Tax=Actinomadura sp. 7K534 TaxID=2530366 RepID=UPI001046AB10|nr:GNAT family N-acetyltransferase [Actinomadura sp. 7K534]TDB92370.1 GNAT family N-acetyltransferase [Actinomadura sp. 7K534]